MPLEAAIWYASELANVMVGQDVEHPAAARDVDSRGALLDWCERCADVIARECSGEPADVFWDRVCAVLSAREPIAVFEHEPMHD